MEINALHEGCVWKSSEFEALGGMRIIIAMMMKIRLKFRRFQTTERLNEGKVKSLAVDKTCHKSQKWIQMSPAVDIAEFFFNFEQGRLSSRHPSFLFN